MGLDILYEIRARIERIEKQVGLANIPWEAIIEQPKPVPKKKVAPKKSDDDS